MKNSVKLEDRENEIEYLRLALALCEVQASYELCDLISDLTKRIESSKGALTIDDCVKIRDRHDKKWSKYYKDLENEK